MADLTDEQLDALAERFVKKVKDTHHEFWIDPESHYLDHVRLREIHKAYSTAQSIAFKSFVGLVAVGTVVLALVGAGWKWLK